MKNILITPFLFLMLLSSFSNAHAQLGWQWGIGNTLGFGEAWPIAPDHHGGMYASGYGLTMIGADTLYGGLFVARVDSAGNYVWARGTKNASPSPVGIATDTAGNVYGLGVYASYFTPLQFDTFSLSTFYGAQEYFLFKISADGIVRWVKNVTNNNAGATYWNGSIGIDGTGNVYIAGVFNCKNDTIGNTPFVNNSDSTYFDAFVAKYDTSGNPVWAKSFGGSKNEFVYALSVNQKGDVYVSGKSGSNTNVISGTTLVNPLSNLTDMMCFLAKFDSAGNLKWAENLSRKIEIAGMKTDRYDNTYMAGRVDSFQVMNTDTLRSTGASDMFLGRYDSMGHVIWATSAGGQSDDKAAAIDVDTCGNIWICGPMGGNALNPGIPYNMYFRGDSVAVPKGDLDPIFIAEYNNAGTFIRGMSLGGGSDDWSGIAVDDRGNVFICGDYEDSSLVVGNDTLLCDRIGPEYLFIAKYKYDSAGCIPEIIVDTVSRITTIPMQALAINLYPNPATDECTVSSNQVFSPGSRVQLYDIAGRLVNTYQLVGTKTVFSLAGFSPGMYQCRITTGDKSVVVKKLVVLK